MRAIFAAACLGLLAWPCLGAEGVVSAEEIARRLGGEADLPPDDQAGVKPPSPVEARSGYRHLPVAVPFASGRSELGEDGRMALDAVVPELQPVIAEEAPVVVAAHTDASGSASANRRLSQARAEAVRDYLAARLRQPVTRIDALGLGESALLTTLPPDDARQRRIELLVGTAPKTAPGTGR